MLLVTKNQGVEKALARGHSMSHYQESRDQYMRLVTQFQKIKIKKKSHQLKTIIKKRKERGRISFGL
ncbi:hypothetical protein QJS10_CPA09g01220 [Acorus calamus]|uniref:Uncharacterized protein n=1 Tax=Acorus calamus TaxID=4465 RepID=A0AAV9E394_ACOCL|nr:hypothetical protein QJS10_CPA09g01220 [Acorus calamus]